MIVGCLRGKAPFYKVDTFFLDFGPLARCKVERKGFNMYDNNDFRQTLLTRQRHLKMLIERKSSAVSKTSCEKVRVEHVKGHTYFFVLLADGSKKSIDKSKARELIQRSYDETIIRSAGRELKVLDRMIKSYPEECVETVINRFSSDRKRLIKPVKRSITDMVENWKATPYAQKQFTNDRPTYKTDKGDLVRSKSELIIANKLFAADIPYRYEARLTLDGHVIHPDFTIFDMRRCREVYWEHLGLMDNAKYVDENIERMNLYSRNGIVIGDRLFVTMESNGVPLDIETVDRIIALFR